MAESQTSENKSKKPKQHVTFNYEWAINHICKQELGEFSISPNFVTEIFNDKLSWRLIIRRRFIDDLTIKVSLYLQLVSWYKRRVTAEVDISLSIFRGSQYPNKGSHTFVEDKINWGFEITCSKVSNVDDSLFLINGYRFNDRNITVVCEVKIIESINELKWPSKLTDDLGSLFENPKFYDVTLSVADREFQAHKAILAARSPVFAKMFEHDMKEKKQNKVDITDVDSSVFEELLKFVYTGKTDNLANMADRLLVAADKYDLKDLKQICEETLIYQLSINNAADYLVLADLLSKELKVQAIKFINDHSADVTNSPGWQSLVQHPHLIIEAYQMLTKQHQQRSKHGIKRPIS